MRNAVIMEISMERVRPSQGKKAWRAIAGDVARGLCQLLLEHQAHRADRGTATLRIRFDSIPWEAKRAQASQERWTGNLSLKNQQWQRRSRLKRAMIQTPN